VTPFGLYFAFYRKAGKIKLIELISRTISCVTLEGPNVYKNFAFEILDKLSKDESEEVRTKVEELMTEFRDRKKDT
jgi:hypothetical protein